MCQIELMTVAIDTAVLECSHDPLFVYGLSRVDLSTFRAEYL